MYFPYHFCFMCPVNGSVPSMSPYKCDRRYECCEALPYAGVEDFAGAVPPADRISPEAAVPISPQKPQIYPSCPTRNYYVVRPGDTLESIACYFNTTVEELLQANLGVDEKNFYVEQYLCIPLAPSPVSVHVKTDLCKLVLYRGGNVFKVYPVAVGKPSTPTPKGTFTVADKQIEPGENLGTRWIGLSGTYLGIHGGGTPDIIGKKATDGNIVMSDEDINEFFNLVPVGTLVKIT